VPDEASFDGDAASLALDPKQIHIYCDGHLVKGDPLHAASPATEGV
jgi:glycerol transport system ATP-binding protein